MAACKLITKLYTELNKQTNRTVITISGASVKTSPGRNEKATFYHQSDSHSNDLLKVLPPQIAYISGVVSAKAQSDS